MASMKATAAQVAEHQRLLGILLPRASALQKGATSTETALNNLAKTLQKEKALYTALVKEVSSLENSKSGFGNIAKLQADMASAQKLLKTIQTTVNAAKSSSATILK